MTSNTCADCGAPSDGVRCEPCFEAQVVTPEGFTVANLRAAFDRVATPDDWKGPIRAFVHHSAVALVTRAVEHFHGEAPTAVGIEALTGDVILEGAGYVG